MHCRVSIPDTCITSIVKDIYSVFLRFMNKRHKSYANFNLDSF